MSSKNPFAALQYDSDSDSAIEEQKKPEEPVVLRIHTPTQSPSYRVWKLDEGEEKPKNVFKTPFSQKKRKQKMESEKDGGWVSIQKNQPQFVDDSVSTDSEQEIKKEVVMEALVLEPTTPPDYSKPVSTEFQSMFNRGTGTTLTAMDWAERVRSSLEKAEQARNKPPAAAQKTEDYVNGLGRLSFFRRPLTTDE